MKNFIIYLIMLLSSNAYAINCEKNLTNNYNFNYKIINNKFNYEIVNKEKIPIRYLSKIDNGISSSLGFYILNLNNNDINFYSTYILRGNFGILKNPEINKDFFITQNTIKESIKINKLIDSFAPLINLDDSVKKIDIKFKITLILDPLLKSCAIFESEAINYNLNSNIIDIIQSYIN